MAVSEVCVSQPSRRAARALIVVGVPRRETRVLRHSRSLLRSILIIRTKSGSSDSEIRLGEWQTFQKMGAAGAPAVRAHHGWARSEENFALDSLF